MKVVFLFMTVFSCLQALGECREESLVQFISQGQPVVSQVIGAGDACDNFGGNLVYTPKNNIFLYVNFNIAGTIDLDQIDQELERIASAESRAMAQKIEIAVVDKGWIKRVYGDDREAIINMGGDTLFVSEIVLTESRFAQLIEQFYSSIR